MKKIKIYILLLFLPWFMSACNDYLKEDSADLLIPSLVNDYVPILLGEAYPDNFSSQIDWTYLMTDDIEMGPLYYDESMYNNSKVTIIDGFDPSMGDGEVLYTWWADYSNYIADKFWDARYKNILACNIVIDALPDMKYEESEYGTYCKLAAQSYALRAYHYFCLVNTYGTPWSEENKNKLGVIKRISPEVDVRATERATVGEIYTLINEDLKYAQQYLKNASTNYSKWEITPAAIYFLASRVALFQEDWDEVIRTSGEFMELGENALYDLNNVDREVCGLPNSTNGGFWINQIDISETVFLFSKEDKRYQYLAPNLYYSNYTLGYHPSWTGEGALLNLYEDGDLRKEVYFARLFKLGGTRLRPEYFSGQAYPMKSDTYMSTSSGQARECWRSPEVYLNMAEAYARKDNNVSQVAIDLLNQVRMKKFSSDAYQAISVSDFASRDELIRFIWEERRRELCFEEAMRFWDMRRQGMPRVEHKYYSSMNSSKTYVLEQGSPNYLLPIPLSETEYNDGVTNNPRVTITGN